MGSLRKCFTAVAALLLCVSCIEREQEIPVPRLGFAEEFGLDYESAAILCTVSGNVTVSDLIIEYSETRDLSDAKTETFLKKGGVFSVTLTGLRNNTEYFYRYTVKNNISTLTDKEIRSFKTPKFINVESVSVEPANLVLQKGETNLLSAKVLPEDASNPDVSWSSGDETIASVSSEGLVTALSPGSTTVTVTTADGGHTASCEIKVEQHAGSIGLDQESVELYESETCQLTATVLPEDAEDKEVEWSTSDEAVATVTGGVVTAVRAGEADITATTRDGGLTSTCHVTVRCHVESISLSEQNLTIYIGDSPVALTATVSPERASDKSLWWSSSASSIASVDEIGKVTPKSSGTATITATSVDSPKVIATCSITVKQHAGGIKLSSDSIILFEGEKSLLEATVLPDDAEDKTVEWSSSDDKVATVSDGEVTAVHAGEADIMAKAHDGGATKTCHVTVKCHVESVSLSEKAITIYVGDHPFTLIATVSPERATDKLVQWSSSDNSVASVDTYGNVMPVSSGTATITATSIDNHDATATCAVTVEKKEPEAVDLGLSVKWATFNVGATSPEDYGDYFAWGETEPYYEPGYAQSSSPEWKSGKSNGYGWSSYKYANGDYNKLTKYCPSSRTDYWDGSGPPDNKIVLDLADDAARAKWGAPWRMPTKAEQDELRKNCYWQWTDNYNGTRIEGRMVTGSNGNSIFIPATSCRHGTRLTTAGIYGSYWSSSLNTDRPNSAYRFYYDPGQEFGAVSGDRFVGFPIRPVYGDPVLVTGVTLNESSLTLDKGKSVTLIATVIPSTAKNQSVTWSSSDVSVASVDSKGRVTGVKAGTATITVTTDDGGYTASCAVEVINAFKPEAVDLGLSVKWATFNVGATSPEEYGDYFAWSETEPYYEPGYARSSSPVWKSGKENGYSWSSYKYANGAYNKLTKYCPSSKTDFWDGSGSPDNKTVLDLADDAARANWGGSWRMPTDAEWTELRNNCTWTWTDNYNDTGIKGRVVTGSNGNSIFLPAAGYRYGTSLYDAGSWGRYWSSSLNTDFPLIAWDINFDSDGVTRYDYTRCYGFSVRPVSE